MAKRRATEQISKDGFPREDSDSSDGGDDGPTTAAPEILATRKIAVPRTRLSKAPAAPSAGSAFESAPGDTSSSKPNPFAGFGQSTSTSTGSAISKAAGKSAGNPFAFLGGNASAEPATVSSETQAADGNHSSKQLRLRGLNTSFAAQIAKASTASPFEDWTVMCTKYIQYSKQIASESQPASTPSSVSVGSNALSSAKPESSTTSGITSTGFKFGGGSTNATTSFQFGDKKVEIKEQAPSSNPAGGFVFNPSGKGEIKTGGGAKVGDKESSPAPSFSFGAKKSADTSADMSLDNSRPADESKLSPGTGASGESKPAFTFGNASANGDSKPKFTFGAAADSTGDSKPKFTFGAAAPAADANKDPAAVKPAFSFGGAAAAAGDSKPKFTFGSADSKAADAKPAFTFGSANSKEADTKPKFTFGSASTDGGEKPKFSFGAAAKDSDKPKFSFGAAASAATTAGDEKPKFSFGAASSENDPAKKPAFSFGTGVNPFGKTDASWKPGQEVKIVNAPGDDAKPEAVSGSAAEGEPSDEQNDPQTDLGGPGPGEENEDTVYEKKSKAFELADGEYKTLGVGFLRVLVHKETKKARALLRAEGSGRVLLNVALRKEFKYTVVGKGQVKLFDVKPGNDVPTVYLLRVKTEQDGEELKDKLEEVKN